MPASAPTSADQQFLDDLDKKLIEALPPKIQPLLDQIVANRTQSRTLATLRDTLLPKLLGGKLAISR